MNVPAQQASPVVGDDALAALDGRGLGASPSRDSRAAAVGDPSDLLHVDVDHVAGRRAVIFCGVRFVPPPAALDEAEAPLGDGGALR